LHVLEVLSPGVVTTAVGLVHQPGIEEQRVRTDRSPAVAEVEPLVPQRLGKDTTATDNMPEVVLCGLPDAHADSNQRGVHVPAPLVTDALAGVAQIGMGDQARL
jgi:hypothetical protein